MKRTQEHERTVFNWMEKRDILKACNGICTHCGKKITNDFTVEHVIPLSKGGSNDPENLVALCKTCNVEKSNQVIEPKEYYRYIPKARLKELQTQFETYCKERDWLTETSMFKTDRFTIKATYNDIMNLRFNMTPTRFTVSKLSNQHVLEFMHAYSRIHGVLPSMPMVTDHINGTYYQITQNGTRLAVFGILFTDFSDETNKFLKTVDNPDNIEVPKCEYMVAMQMDLFTDPEIGQNPETIAATAEKVRYVLRSIRKEINKTATRNKRTDIIRLITSASRTDTAATTAIGREVYENVPIANAHPIVCNLINRPYEKFTATDTKIGDPEIIQRIEYQIDRICELAKQGKVPETFAMQVIISLHVEEIKPAYDRIKQDQDDK